MNEQLRLFRSACVCCTLIVTAACADNADGTETEGAGLLASDEIVSKVSVGMTRDDVIDTLGIYYKSLTPPGFAPVCDTYRYIEEGQERYVHIWYRGNSGVSEVSSGNVSICGIT